MKSDNDPACDMPPPQSGGVLTPHLRNSIARLVSEAQQASINWPPVYGASSKRHARTQTDYTLLVRAWYQSIPPAARQRRFHTDELLLRFAGRYFDRPARRMIAAALRANGFTSHRDWTRAGRNGRYWLPPAANPVNDRKSNFPPTKQD